jgi:hypothetical protein
VMPKFKGGVPSSWLSDMRKFLIEERLKIEGGTVPDNLLPSSAICERFSSLPRASGILPPI